MTDVIIVEPAPELRAEFARWGLYYQPAFRTVSPFEFEVPAAAFTDCPEELLIGSIVDGHRYRSPIEDDRNGTPPPGAPEPELVPGSWPGPEEAAEFAPLEDAPADEPAEADASAEDADGVNVCGTCGRDFATQRGLNKHRTAAHAEES